MTDERKQGKTSSKPNAEQRRMGSSGEGRRSAGDQSVGTGGTMGAGKSLNQPRPQTHKKSLSLQIEAVRSRKALLQQEIEQLDRQEQQLVETLQAYEENISGLNA